jgi:uncharacterized protein (DUF58 family)
VGSFEKSNQEEHFEHTLEVVASLAVKLDRMGYAVGFAANGTLKGGHSSGIPLTRGPGQIPAILETLARLQATPTGDVTKVIRQFIGSQRGISCVHFCYEDEPSATEMEKFFQKRQISVSFVVCRRKPNSPLCGKSIRFSIDEIRLDRSRQT